MKKIFRNVFMLILAVALLAGTCGCGNQNTASSEMFSSSTSLMENQMTERQMNEILQEENLYYTPSSIFSAKTDSIWYLVSEEDFDKGKDGKVCAIYVFNNGKCNRYPVDGDYTLGELAKMSDEEIVSALKNTNLFGSSAQSAIEADSIAEYAQKIRTVGKVTLSNEYEIHCEVTMPDTSMHDIDYGHYNITVNATCDMTPIAEAFDKYCQYTSDLNTQSHNSYYEIDPKLSVFTDKTGNHVACEQFICSYMTPAALDISAINAEYYGWDGFDLAGHVENQFKHLTEFSSEDYFGSEYGYFNWNFIADEDEIDEFGELISRQIKITPEMLENCEEGDMLHRTYNLAYHNRYEDPDSPMLPDWKACTVNYLGRTADATGTLNLNFSVIPEVEYDETTFSNTEKILFSVGLPNGDPWASQQIYDSYYNGFSVRLASHHIGTNGDTPYLNPIDKDDIRWSWSWEDNIVSGDRAVFVTRTKNPTAKFALDYVGTEGVDVDPEEPTD